MALKFNITKAVYDALSDELKGEYIAGEKDGEYVLDVQGLPQGEDVGPIKRALEAERTAKNSLKRDLDAANLKIAEFPNVDELKATHKQETGKLKTFVDNSLRDSVATSMAAKISTAPNLLAPHIASRLKVDLSGDEPKTVILGKDGKPDPEMTLELLQQEVVANPEYKAIIIASKASGGGAPKSPLVNRPGSGTLPQDGERTVDLSKLHGKDLVAALDAKKAASAEAQQ